MNNADSSGLDSDSTQKDNQNSSDNLKKRILLVEDDASMRRLLEVVLDRAGYEVTTAEDGLLAIQAAGETAFDLAIIDAIMPNLSGYEVCRIFKTHPYWQKMPLVLMSGMEHEPDSNANIQLLKSPRLQEELLAAVSNLLDSRG